MNKLYLDKIKKNEVWSIIPARSGSKGVPDKNIRLLSGYPLIAHTIAVSKLSKEIDRTIVSTDSEKYAKIAKFYGAETPFLRPAEYSTDSSQDIDFMRHAIEWFAENEGCIPEYWVHLRITCPLRKAVEVDEIIRKIKDYPDATSLLSVCIPKGVLTPFKWMIKDGDHLRSIFFENNDDANRPRQTYPEAYSRSIYADIYKTSNIIENEILFGKSIVPFETEEMTDIDDISDLEKVQGEIIDSEVVKYLEEHGKYEG